MSTHYSGKDFNFNQRSDWFKTMLSYQIEKLAQALLGVTDDMWLHEATKDQAQHRLKELCKVMKGIGHKGMTEDDEGCCDVCVPLFAKNESIIKRDIAEQRKKITDARITNRLMKDIEGLDVL
jgi:ketopantoate reductase